MGVGGIIILAWPPLPDWLGDDPAEAVAATWWHICLSSQCLDNIIIKAGSGITSHTSHGHETGTMSMQPERSVPLGLVQKGVVIHFSN